MGRCCDSLELTSPDLCGESWPGLGRFRNAGCLGLHPNRGLPGSSAAYHTNPYHPLGWWPPPPPATVALAPPQTVRSEGVLMRRTDAAIDVDIKYVVDPDLIVDDLPEGADRDSHLALLTDKGAVTGITHPRWTEFSGTKRFHWKGSVRIRTIYRRKADASGYSCYGRGTARGDVEQGRVTLGFHEWCHRQFFIDYLKAHPLPLPALTAGMTHDRFRREMERFERAAGEYDSTVRRLNEQSVDEVGHLRSQYVQTRQCYAHTLPLR